MDRNPEPMHKNRIEGSGDQGERALSEALHAELSPLGIHVAVDEPRYFRTDFLDSSSAMEAGYVIADCAETAGKVHMSASAFNGRQPGDPKRLAQALLTLISAANPPLRLQLSTDALTRVREKHAFVEQEMRTWETLSRSTDFPT